MTTIAEHAAMQDLEALVDKHGLLQVVVALEQVCAEKSDHILTNWQDKALAREWGYARNRLFSAAKYISNLDI